MLAVASLMQGSGWTFVCVFVMVLRSKGCNAQWYWAGKVC
jgi:hypothetical protein